MKGKLLAEIGPVVLTLERASECPGGLVTTHCEAHIQCTWFSGFGVEPQDLLLVSGSYFKNYWVRPNFKV